VSKKFKDQLCVYCAERPSSSADHVFARKFFLPGERANLPKVPACAGCNATKSELEHHYSLLLPFGGRHAMAEENLETLVPKRLTKNAKLHRRLVVQRSTVWSNVDGPLFIPTMGLPNDPARLEIFVSLIVRGLMWYHWRIYLTRDHVIEVLTPNHRGMELLDEHLFNRPAHREVVVTLGGGTMAYRGIQTVDCPHASAWKLLLLGGLVFAEKGRLAERSRTSSQIVVLTRPKRNKLQKAALLDEN
jgi:hypothetical protein